MTGSKDSTWFTTTLGSAFPYSSVTYRLAQSSPSCAGERGSAKRGLSERVRELICKLLNLKEKVSIKVVLKVAQKLSESEAAFAPHGMLVYIAENPRAGHVPY